MKITIYNAEDGYRWRARAANGEIVVVEQSFRPQQGTADGRFVVTVLGT
jgi:uncharacterized protein YegP (UPF0339 family)